MMPRIFSTSFAPFRRRRRGSWLALMLLAAATAPAAEPALVVVITVDQFRADYLARFGRHFGPDGFNLLLQQGANFTDCRYRHAITKTACGHATLLTGVHAEIHGIIDNSWIDRDTLARVNCVEDDRVELIGLAAPRSNVRMPGRSPTLGASPRRLLATTVGGEFKLSRGAGPKVIGVSDVAPTLARMLGVLPPPASQGRMLF